MDVSKGLAVASHSLSWLAFVKSLAIVLALVGALVLAVSYYQVAQGQAIEQETVQVESPQITQQTPENGDPPNEDNSIAFCEEEEIPPCTDVYVCNSGSYCWANQWWAWEDWCDNFGGAYCYTVGPYATGVPC